MAKAPGAVSKTSTHSESLGTLAGVLWAPEKAGAALRARTGAVAGGLLFLDDNPEDRPELDQSNVSPSGSRCDGLVCGIFFGLVLSGAVDHVISRNDSGQG